MSLSPLLPSQFDNSGVNVAQTALTDDFISANPKFLTKYMRPSGIGTDKLSKKEAVKENRGSFNVLGVVMAALVFIIILSWFELMRLIIQSYFIRSKIVLEQMISYFIYTVVGTMFALLLLYLCYRISSATTTPHSPA
jgi:hypothetical protein